MGIVRRILGRSPRTVFDPFLGDGQVRGVYDKLVSGDWSELDAFLDARPDEWLVARQFSSDDSKVGADTVARWAGAKPSARSLSLLGSIQTRDAWAIRGRSYAKDVDPAAWQGFFDGLEVAEATLMDAVRLEPDSADPWVALMTTARGLQHDKDELARRFAEAHKRSAFRPDACETRLGLRVAGHHLL